MRNPMQLMTSKGPCLGALCGTLLLVGMSAANAQPKTIAVLGGTGAVVSCWEDRRRIDPLACVGREVVALGPYETTRRGRVVARTIREDQARVPDEGAYLPYEWLLPRQPIPISEFANDMYPKELSESIAYFKETDDSAVRLPLPPLTTQTPFNRATAELELRKLLQMPQSDRGDDLLWVDIDDDRVPEAIVMSQSGECIDQVVVHFSKDGTVYDAGGAVARRAKNKCLISGLLGSATDCDYRLSPWPAAVRGHAVVVSCAVAGADGFAEVYLSLANIETAPEIIGIMHYEWVWFGDYPQR